MHRISSSEVELTEQELAMSQLHEQWLDRGHDHATAVEGAWLDLQQYGWLPSVEFIDWLVGPAPEEIVTEMAYSIHCRMQTCPDHGAVCFVDGGESPSMAGGYDSSETWSCGCTIMTTPYSHTRRRPDGTHSDDCGER